MLKGVDKLKSIIISGYYGFENCGDEAILLAIIQEFSKYIPKEKIVVLSHNPHKTKLSYQVNSIHRLNPFLIIYKMLQTSVFVSGGGGLLQDVTGKGYSVFYYLSLLFLASLFNIPSIVYAQGIGPIEKNLNRKLIKWVLNKVDLIMVRDKPSKVLLQELGISGKTIKVNADPSFLLKKTEISESKKIKPESDQPEETYKKTNIGIVLRNCREIARDYDNKLDQFAKIADHLVDKYQANLFFIPFQANIDSPFMRKIIKRMENSSAVRIEEECRPEQVLILYTKLSLIIGMRFHSIVFAVMENKPFLAIDYDPKVRYFVNDLNTPELLININKLTVKIIDNKLKYISTNKKRIQAILNEKKEIFEKKAYCNVRQFYEFITEKYLS